MANALDGSLSVIDPATEAVVSTVAVGQVPLGLAAHPDGSALYVEAHPPLPERLSEESSALTELTRAFVAFAEEGQGSGFDWDLAEQVATTSRGIPEFISTYVPAASVPVTDNVPAGGGGL